MQLAVCEYYYYVQHDDMFCKVSAMGTVSCQVLTDGYWGLLNFYLSELFDTNKMGH